MAKIADNELAACFYGFNKPYGEYLAKMHELHEQVVQKKTPQQLMLLEHAPVITITKQYGHKSLKTTPSDIAKDGIELIEADRGGDATFHGPGQLVGYPILRVNSNDQMLDVVGHVRKLEAALLQALQRLGLTNVHTLPGFSGIWVKARDDDKLTLKKLAAIGVGVSNAVSKHGFALNINIDYQKYAEHIIPCGLADRGVITLQEAFFAESLEMPTYWAMVEEISWWVAEFYSLSLKWQSKHLAQEQKNGARHHHAATR